MPQRCNFATAEKQGITEVTAARRRLVDGGQRAADTHPSNPLASRRASRSRKVKTLQEQQEVTPHSLCRQTAALAPTCSTALAGTDAALTTAILTE